MRIIDLTPDNWEKYGRVFLQFVKRYEKRYESDHCFSWLYHLRKSHLCKPGNAVKISYWDGKIIAAFALSDYGKKNSVMLIAPNYEQTAIGSKLIKAMKKDLGVCYLKISYRSPLLVKTALNAGLVGLGYSHKKCGDLLLWFGGGNWNLQDIAKQEASGE
ncbi:hypothetical protein [Bacillus alkalicellulosilyticus]|uniref:hypothetical protein n=1 Tax=Alkalihalobacterium alkalicellulosilyticum TaxID=1912214 RepID=UPI0009973B38|nr:hypothetical protein [Bacillus alkalicellulosilyticus]